MFQVATSIRSELQYKSRIQSWRSDQTSGLRPNLIWTLQSNQQLNNVKIQTFLLISKRSDYSLSINHLFFLLIPKKHKQTFASGLNVQNIVIWYKYKYRNGLWPMQYVFLIRSSAGRKWRISYRRRESVSKTRIAWARDRFYFYC